MVGGSSALTLDSHSGAVTPGGFGIWLLKAGLYPNTPPPHFHIPKGNGREMWAGLFWSLKQFLRGLVPSTELTVTTGFPDHSPKQHKADEGSVPVGLALLQAAESWEQV